VKGSRVGLLRRPEGPIREIPTPEGVPLRFELAIAGDRAGAFLIDAAIIAVTLFLLLLCASVLGIFEAEASLALSHLALFLIRNFYFSGLEILWGGRTIGKRLLGLQVIDGSGRALRVEALFARNLTREVEVFLPLAVVLGGSEIVAGMNAAWRVGTILWVLFFALFPFFNRDRLRLGDLFAGTLVVRSPRPALLPDLVSAKGAPSAVAQPGAIAFAREHLDAYGIYELQVLEKVLRQRSTPAETLRAVAEKIVEKTGWTGRIGDSRRFLEAFYRAQRAHLEGRLLLGDRREDKSAAEARRRGPPTASPPTPPAA
jgi:uncharacterized RDD family membrane protein YckC